MEQRLKGRLVSNVTETVGRRVTVWQSRHSDNWRSLGDFDLELQLDESASSVIHENCMILLSFVEYRELRMVVHWLLRWTPLCVFIGDYHKSYVSPCLCSDPSTLQDCGFRLEPDLPASRSSLGSFELSPIVGEASASARTEPFSALSIPRPERASLGAKDEFTPHPPCPKARQGQEGPPPCVQDKTPHRWQSPGQPASSTLYQAR